MRGPRFRYRRRKACAWHHQRTPDTLVSSMLPPQQRRLHMAQSLILRLVALMDRRHFATLPHLSRAEPLTLQMFCRLDRRSWRVPLTGLLPAWDWILRLSERRAPMPIPALSFVLQ
jgi:hypothetical protein